MLVNYKGFHQPPLPDAVLLEFTVFGRNHSDELEAVSVFFGTYGGINADGTITTQQPVTNFVHELQVGVATDIIKTVTDMNAWNLDMFGSGCYNTDVVRREIKAWINHTNTGTAMKFDDINDVSGAREQSLL